MATSEFYYRHLLLYRELVTEDEIRACIEVQDQSRAAGHEEPRLADLLVEYGYLSPSQLQRLEDEITRFADEQRSGYLGPQIPGYKIERLVGENATGQSYIAHQKSLRRNVSLKVLNPEFLTDRRAVEQYYTEAAAAARAGHPNIVQLVDLGFDPSGALYIVRELVEGESVQQILERDGRMDPVEAAGIALGVARGLAYIHDIGLIHGHIRPSNILVPPDRIAKLQDLGISRNVPDSGESRKRILGNPLYMAPEQLRGAEHVDYGADLYALGATLYHMVVGRPPFVANTPKELFELVNTRRPTPAHKEVPGVPAELGRIIQKLLAKNPAERYADADVPAGQLEEFIRRRRLSGGAAAPSAPTTQVVEEEPPVPAGAGGGPAAWAALAATVLLNCALAAWYFLR